MHQTIPLRRAAVLLCLGLAMLITGCTDGGVSRPAAVATSSWAPPSSPSLPTPDEDGEYIYRDLTFDQAQQIAPFELVEPTQLPPGVELVDIRIKEQSDALPESGQDPRAVFVFSPGSPEHAPFVLDQQSYAVKFDEREGGISRLTIEGVDVARREFAVDGNARPVSHIWTRDGVTFVLTRPDGPGHNEGGR